MSALERNPQVPAPTPHKVLGPGIDGRGIPRGPRATPMGTGISRGLQSGSLRTTSQVESTCRNSSKSRRFSPPGEMRPISAEASRGYSHLNSGTSKGSFTPLLQIKSSARFPSPLEREHESPAYIQRSPFPPPSPTGGIHSLRVRKRIPGVPVTSQEGALYTGKARGNPGSCHHS